MTSSPICVALLNKAKFIARQLRCFCNPDPPVVKIRHIAVIADLHLEATSIWCLLHPTWFAQQGSCRARDRSLGEHPAMSDKRSIPGRQVTNLRPVPSAPVDENTASMIELLQEQLKLARAGKLRSLAVVSVSSDGSAIGTQWSCSHGDTASLIGKLTVLTNDLMAARK
jgi:hypothetical protein